VRIALYVEDVDAVAERAVAHGASLLVPIADQFYGDRGGRVADRFRHIWILATHQEDVSQNEMQKRMEAI
jgi:PhnB protein